VEVGAAANITGGSSMEDNHRIGSYLSKLDYSYKDKYFLSLSYRRDGTSRFSAENRWGNFGAGGLSWRISKENFMDGVSGWLNDLILRASYGTQGNERISNYYAYRGLYNVTSDLGATAFQLSTLTNDALHWENTKQTNIGLSASLFKRITVDFDYFIKKTDDMLFNRSLPVSSGVASIAENVGDLKNQGFDIQIHSSNLESSKGLNWQTTINLSHYTNRIVRLPSQEISNGLFRWAVGTSAYNYYLPKWLGVNPDDGKPLWLKETFLMDADGNPVINSKGERTVTKTEITEDYTQATYNYRGSALPDLFGNIINNFSYRAFDLSFNFYFSIGGQFFDYAYQRLSHPGSRQPVVDFTEDAMDYWTPEHKNASFTRLTDYGPEGNNYFANSTRYLVNDTYLRLRDVTLGYTLPVSLGSRIGVSSIRVFVQADNQLTFFKYKNKGVDPEQPIGGLLDITAMPVAKFIIGGISVKF
jgi:TonB-linked SusC/RagA family outer membrane protein